MKLPEYDNRPGPGQPLYSDKSGSSSEWDGLKFGLGGLLLLLGLLTSVGFLIYGLISLLRSLLH